jgi:hypothetical protein
VDIGLVWIPSYLDIDGNERADQLAKKGSAANTPECNDHYTSKALLQESEGTSDVTMENRNWNDPRDMTRKYPLEWGNCSFRDSKAIFGIYCGRTEVDPRPNNDDKPCQCGIDLISTSGKIPSCVGSICRFPLHPLHLTQPLSYVSNYYQI